MKDKVAQHHTAFDTLLHTAVSEAQLEANKRNAWMSTGPTTETGKRVSSMNALKTGLTGKTVLLPSDDAQRYEKHVERFFADRKPTGDRESELVQSMADAQWRLNRIPSLEMGIYALGRLQFADQFESHDPAVAAALLESYIFLQRQKELKNLALQESRLRRQYQKDSAELAQLQNQRAAQPAGRTTQAIDNKSAIENGFEFSTVPAATLEPTPISPNQPPGQTAPNPLIPKAYREIRPAPAT